MSYGIFRKVTTLELFQHHFAKSGHGDGLLMTRQLISTVRRPPLHYLTRSVRRTSGFVLADHPGATWGWLLTSWSKVIYITGPGLRAAISPESAGRCAAGRKRV